jgi:hypothetical protein
VRRLRIASSEEKWLQEPYVPVSPICDKDGNVVSVASLVRKWSDSIRKAAQQISPYNIGWIKPSGELLFLAPREEHWQALDTEGFKPSPEIEEEMLKQVEEDDMYDPFLAVDNAVSMGWIRWAGGRSGRYWTVQQPEGVSFQINGDSGTLERLKEALQNNLDSRVKEVYVETPGQYFNMKPEEFIQGYICGGGETIKCKS